MNETEWSKQYIVFSISRLYLQHHLGFSRDEFILLSDHDLQRIAEDVRKSYSYLEDDFGETVRFVTSVVLSEKSDKDNCIIGGEN